MLDYYIYIYIYIHTVILCKISNFHNNNAYNIYVVHTLTLIRHGHDSSTKCINNDYLINVVLGLAAVIQNVVTNAAICNSCILKSKHMIYECDYLNSRILKSFFTLILKRAAYAFILSFFFALPVFSLFLLWCSSLLLRVSLCSCTIVSSFRFALFLFHQWFINFFHFTYLFVFLHWQRVL